MRPPLTTASTAIRRPRVDRGSGLDVPALFPDDGRLTRKPPSLHRLRAGWPVRRLQRYDEALRRLPARRSGLIGFAADLPPCASDASLPVRLTGNRRARVHLGSADPNSRTNGGNRQASQVPGDLLWTRAMLSDPGGTSALGLFHASVLPSAGSTESAPTIGRFRGSIAWPTASLSTLRRLGYPMPAQDSLPAGGLLCRTGFEPAGDPS